MENYFKSLQGMKTLVCEQRQQLSKLEMDLIARCNIHGPTTLDEKDRFNQALQQNPMHGFALDDYYVTSQQIRAAADEVGGFVQIQMDTLEASGVEDDKLVYDQIIRTIGNFALQLVIGVQKVVAERDGENNAANELPAVLPLDIFVVNS